MNSSNAQVNLLVMHGDIKYDGQFIQVTEEVIENQTWERAYFKDGLIIFPINKAGNILFLNEKRPHEKPNFRIKPVTGIYEEHIDLFENANREMQEEIGFKANQIELLYEYKSTGAINSTQRFVTAYDLEESKIPNPDGEDTIVDILEISVGDLADKILTDEIAFRHFSAIYKLQHIIKLKSEAGMRLQSLL